MKSLNLLKFISPQNKPSATEKRRLDSMKNVRTAVLAVCLGALGSMAAPAQFNTQYGTGALPGSTGSSNAAFGYDALNSNIEGGVYNTATGYTALYANTTGNNNTATGVSALESNTTGWGNSAFGSMALQFNSTGSNNTVTGFSALRTYP
jgi:hypothetical protein